MPRWSRSACCRGWGFSGSRRGVTPSALCSAVCAIGYTLCSSTLVGRQPLLMPAYMFGGALVSTMVVLFIGVVRWGRKQP